MKLFSDEQEIWSLPIELFGTDTPLPITTPDAEVFGGLFKTWQITPVWPILLLIFVAIIATIIHHAKTDHPSSCRIGLTLIGCLSVLTSLKISAGWDELYLNLRHSYMMKHHGLYSFNLSSLGEGTVDFVVFFLTGLLGMLSFPLVETTLVLTLCGNVLLVIYAYKLSFKLTDHSSLAMLVALGVGIFPSVLFVGGTGFTATLFSAIILMSFYYLFLIPEKKMLGLLFLSSLTLFRIEGIALTFLVWIYLFVIKPAKYWLNPKTFQAQFIESFKFGLLLSAPFLLSLVVRHMAFGYAIPVCVTHKNVGGQMDYLMRGFSQITNTILNYYLYIVFIFLIFPMIDAIKKKRIPADIYVGLLILMIFSVPYYLSGGDWFPEFWARYMMPFLVFLMIVFWCTTWQFLSTQQWSNTVKLMVIVLLISGPYAVGHTDQQRVTYLKANPYKQLLHDIMIVDPRWPRIEHLGYLGRLYNLTTPPEARIASSELATMMYFAKRDIIGLIGITNPEIAHAPLNPRIEEIGDLFFRRRNPDVVTKHLPEIIVFNGMIHWRGNKQVFNNQMIENAIDKFRHHNFKKIHAELSMYRAGSYPHLAKLGYHNIVLTTPRANCFYLVHQSIYQHHIKALKVLGFRSLGEHDIPYIAPDQEYIAKFGEPELLKP